jgi:type II secretory pathway component PulF
MTSIPPKSAARAGSRPDILRPAAIGAAPANGGLTMRSAELELLIRQLARMLKAGLTLDRALAILSARDDKNPVTTMALDLRKRLRAGATPGAAFGAHPKSFSRSTLALIAAGDGGGRLAAALGDVEQMIVAKNQMSSRMRSAMIYPGILTTVAIGSVLTILLFVIPKFKDLVMGQWDNLPMMSRAVFWLSDLAVSGGWMMGLALVLLLGFVVRLAMTGALEQGLISAMGKIPGIGPITTMSVSARLLRIIGTQLSCAVPLVDALSSAAAGSENPATHQALERMRGEVRGGMRLSQAMRLSRLFPETALQLAEVGEETGDSGGMIRRAAELIEEDIDRSVKRIFIVFEPMLLVVLGLVIGALLYGLFSAILTLNQSVL